MGAKDIIAKLDTEIEAMETKIYGPKEPAEPNAVGQPAQGSGNASQSAPPAATGTDGGRQTEMKFDVSNSGNGGPQGEPTDKPTENWKKRYTNLKKHHDAEVYKNRKELGDLYESLGQARAEIDRLSTELAKAKPAPSIRDFATQEEIDTYGEEELTTMQRLAQKTAETQTAELRKQLAEAQRKERAQEAQRAEAARQQAASIFLDKLEALVPDYEDIDKDPAFERWLNGIDYASGLTRMQLFKNAENQFDVGRVASFFNTYKQLVKQNLDQRITPVGNSATPTTTNRQPQGKQPQVVPMADYLQFMDDVTRGRYKGRESEAREKEAFYNKAMYEGRLR